MDPPSITVSISDGNVRDRMRRSLSLLGFHALIADADPSSDLDQWLPRARWLALVYDMKPWDERAVAIVNAVRQRFPFRPILLYVPAQPGLDELTERLDRSAVFVRHQYAGAPNGECLKRALTRLCRAVTPIGLGYLLRRPTEALPDPLAPFVDCALWMAVEPRPALYRRADDDHEISAAAERSTLRAPAKRTAPRWLSVEQIAAAAAAQVSGRTLERRFPRAGWPEPREVVPSLLLLSVLFTADQTGTSWARVVRGLNLDRRRVEEAWRALCPDRPTLGNVQPDQALDAALVAFAVQCRIPQTEAEQIAQSRRGW